jgi:hypothetical protein
MLRSIFPLFFCLFGCAGLQEAEPPTPAPEPEPSQIPVLCVAVIGASFSGGYGLRSELETNFDLARTLALALKAPQVEAHSLANNVFIQNPEGLGKGQVARAQEFEPTLVIGLDFLFWYAYGYRRGCEARLLSLEEGLATLDQFECPVLVGDLIDATQALSGSTAFAAGRSVLRPRQIPHEDCLTQLNARIKEWADSRSNVHVYSLSKYYEEAFKPGSFSLRGNVYGPERKPGLMQADLLHSTFRGTAAVCLSALDALVAGEVLDEDIVRWDAAQLEQAIWDTTEAEREERRERRAERDRRKAARAAERETSKSP